MDTETQNISIAPDLNIFTGGDWIPYQDALYKIFIATLTKGGLTFFGLPVHPQRRPEYLGKHFTFWHLISEGEVEQDRTPDLRRCERLHWIEWVLKNYNTNPDITFWENKRKRDTHIVIWYEKEKYAVILAKRNGYYIIKSAYMVSERRAEIFKTEREQYKKTNRS